MTATLLFAFAPAIRQECTDRTAVMVSGHRPATIARTAYRAHREDGLPRTLARRATLGTLVCSGLAVELVA